MTRQRKALRGLRWISGAALVTAGVLMVYANLYPSIHYLSSIISAKSYGALGFVPSVLVAVSQILRAHAAHHQECGQSALQHWLVSCRPLLLVTAGTVISKGAFADQERTAHEKSL